MRLLSILSLAFLPSLPLAQTTPVDDGPWIAIPVGMTFEAQLSPAEEIKAMADLDGDPSVTTKKELQMIALLSQILGSEPVEQ